MDHSNGTRRRTQFLYGRGELVVYATFVVLSLCLILLPDSPKRALATHIEDYALYPFRQTVLTAERVLDLWETNRRLAEDVGVLALELARLDEVRLENDRLREMLDLSRRSRFKLVGCEILAEGGGRLGDRTLLLDRGFNHGILRDMPITTRNGLAGKIIEVYPAWSRAILLTHPAAAVSVRDKRSRVAGIVEWMPEATSRLKLRSVSYLADVAVGDALISSGLGGVFPAGLPVGTIAKIERDENGLLLDITVNAAADFNRLEEVFALIEDGGDPLEDTVSAVGEGPGHP